MWATGALLCVSAGVALACVAALVAGLGRGWTATLPTGEDQVVSRIDGWPPEEARRYREALYARNCEVCHGPGGEGDGYASREMTPPPANLTRGVFKFRSTETGSPPTRQDVIDTVTRGLPGTSMHGFEFLSAADRLALADHVFDLAGIDAEGVPIAVGAPPEPSEALVAHGRDVYLDLGCDHCHGPHGRGDGPATPELMDDDGRPLRARDFYLGHFRGGDAPEDLYRRLVTGIDGTPMPAFANSFETEDDAWALVFYLLSLGDAPRPYPRRLR